MMQEKPLLPLLEVLPIPIGPRVLDEYHSFFANKIKRNSQESVSFPEFQCVSPINQVLNLESFLPNNIKIPTRMTILNDSIANESSKSNKESIVGELNSNYKKSGDFLVPFSSKINNKPLPTKTTKSEQKKIDFKKRLTQILTNVKPKSVIANFLNSVSFQIAINLLTIYVLFADDIRTCGFSKSTDPIFDSITLTCLGIFSIEILASAISQKGYFSSFFFYLDIISTVSLLFDVVWFQEATLFKSNTSMNATQLARMGRASRIGTRAARIIRLLRLFRIVKLYKSTMSKKVEEAQKNKNEPLIHLSKIPPCENPNKTNKESILKTSLYETVSPGIRISLLKQMNPAIPRKSSGFSQQKRPSRFSGHPIPVENQGAFISKLSHKWYMNSPELSRSESPVKSNIKSPSLHNILMPNNESMKNESMITDKDVSIIEIEEEIKLKESTVGKKLSLRTTKKVILMVLIMVIIVPMFDSRFYFEPKYSFISGVVVLAGFQNSTTGEILVPKAELDLFCKDYIAREIKNEVSKLIYLSTPYMGTDCEFFQSKSPSELRFDAQYMVQNSLFNNTQITAIIDQTYSAYYNSVINMLRTVFVTLILSIGTLLFSRDANELVLNPIERMIEKVNKIALNPLCMKDLRLTSDSKQIQNELVLIENSIIKIGTLLALGFGEAGKEIIASNVTKKGDVEPLTRGTRKYAVYGFCDIRNFTDATEVLQEEVMVFVNNIAEIVHGVVDRCLGSANKNIGDAFLLVWKLPDLTEEMLQLQENTRKVTDICDLAVFSFLKIIGRLNRHPRILKYRTNEKLSARFKDYHVKLGFGLHFGWSIEGAIGSDFKIDASYLSPNVNLASRLEAATKQYGVPFLFSSELYRCLSDDIKAFSRKIDFVTLKGSVVPLGLYTIDIDIEGLPPSKEEAIKSIQTEKRKLQKEAMRALYETKAFTTKDVFCYDKDLRLLMKRYEMDLNIYEIFSKGLEAYLLGEWGIAKEKFEEFLSLKGNGDSPTYVLMEFMKKNMWKSPENWPGYRELVEK